MKLVIATPLYPPEIGGPATDSSALVSALTQKGHEAVVCAFRDVKHLPKMARHIAYTWRVRRAARGAHAIVAFDTVSVGAPALVAAKLRRIPLVVRIPGDYAWEQGVQRFGIADTIEIFQTKKYGSRVEFFRALQRYVVQHVDLVLVISDYFENLVSTWGIDPDCLKRIYLGIDPAEPFQLPVNVPEGKIIFTLGRFVPWKGFGMLIDLMKELPAEWHLVIAGDGPLRPRLAKQAADGGAGIGGRVTFTGPLPHAQALGWYRKADAFVLNTSFESFSFQVLEAMASGVPVITTRIGSIPELIANGSEGVLCDPDDKVAFKAAILSTQKDHDLWRARTEAAKHKAAQFSLSASAEAFAAVVTDLCA